MRDEWGQLVGIVLIAIAIIAGVLLWVRLSAYVVKGLM